MEPTMKEIVEWLIEGGIEAANVILLRGGESGAADVEQDKWRQRAAQVEVMGEKYHKSIKLLVDAEMIFPGSSGRGDISREQRTHADVRRFLAKIYPDEYEKKL